MTPAKIKILKAVSEYKHPEYGTALPPTVKEIAEAAGKAKSTVQEHLAKLYHDGYLEKIKEGCHNRNYRVSKSGRKKLKQVKR